MILSTVSLLFFLSNSLKYLRLNSSHFFSSCPNHFLNELLGAKSFCHRSILVLSLLKPRGQSLSTNILKLLSPSGLSYIRLILIINSKGMDIQGSWINKYFVIIKYIYPHSVESSYSIDIIASKHLRYTFIAPL